MSLTNNVLLKAKLDTSDDVHSPVALFISKVWMIVDQADTDNLISWSKVNEPSFLKKTELK